MSRKSPAYRTPGSPIHATGADLRDAIAKLLGNWRETKRPPPAKYPIEVFFSPTRSGSAASTCLELRVHGYDQDGAPRRAQHVLGVRTGQRVF
jgi:hypothetical protein